MSVFEQERRLEGRECERGEKEPRFDVCCQV